VFYEQFKFFFNFYFLVVALSQFIPALKIGEFHSVVTYVQLRRSTLTGA
jgi:phospholipid-translocating ATPase